MLVSLHVHRHHEVTSAEHGEVQLPQETHEEKIGIVFMLEVSNKCPNFLLVIMTKFSASDLHTSEGGKHENDDRNNSPSSGEDVIRTEQHEDRHQEMKGSSITASTLKYFDLLPLVLNVLNVLDRRYPLVKGQ